MENFKQFLSPKPSGQDNLAKESSAPGGGKNAEKDSSNPNRREFLKTALVGAVWGLLFGRNAKEAQAGRKKNEKKELLAKEPLPPGAVEFAKELEKIKRNPAHERMGEAVFIEDIMYEDLPVPDPEKVLGAKRGIVISKKFHRFWLFDDGKLILHGPIGSALEKKGYHTPTGKFKVLREEGKNYSSREYPSTSGEPNMPWAVFFTNRGHAVHGSPQAFPQEFVPKEKLINGWEVMHLDRSHGCVNAKVQHAQIINKTLKKGDPIVILP